MLDILIAAVLSGLGAYYFTMRLVYNFGDEDSNNGPFKWGKVFVYNPMTQQSRQFNFWDIPRALFGLFSERPKAPGIPDVVFQVNTDKVDSAWSCPHCLGFWVAFIFALFFTRERTVGSIMLATFAAAGINSVIVYVIEGLQKHGESLQLRSSESQDRGSGVGTK